MVELFLGTLGSWDAIPASPAWDRLPKPGRTGPISCLPLFCVSLPRKSRPLLTRESTYIRFLWRGGISLPDRMRVLR